FVFFFQAEDGIRDPLVTGVQTCALPISINAVQPVLSLGTMFGSARWPNRSLTMARNPYEEANIKAVRPSALVAFTSAPASVSAETVSACPSAAAIISGVQPLPNVESRDALIGLFTLTFSSISFLIQSVLPAQAPKYGSDTPHVPRHT